VVKSFDVRLDDCLATLKDLLEAERVGICYVMLCCVMLNDIIVHYYIILYYIVLYYVLSYKL
jgi:hypothetical protein